jgi:hypothetical protein
MIFFLFVGVVWAQFGDPTPRSIDGMDLGPVYVPTGKLHYSETDLSVPGRGLGFEFTRYYTNYWAVYQDPMYRRGPSWMGANWNHSYNWGLRYEGELYGDGYNYWTIITPSRALQTFKDLNNNTYEAEPGVRAKLERPTTLHWIYTTKHGIRYHLNSYYPGDPRDPSYALTQIEDPNGNTIQVVYDGYSEVGNPLPRIKAVVDSLGRIAKFYYENGAYPRYITRIEFGVGNVDALSTVYQTVTYLYTPFESNLVLTSAHLLLSANDPRGTELVTTYQNPVSGCCYMSLTGSFNRGCGWRGGHRWHYRPP